MDHVVGALGVSERRACRVLGQHRSTQRKVPTTPDDEAALVADIVELVRQFGRFGYRRITKMLKTARDLLARIKALRVERGAPF